MRRWLACNWFAFTVAICTALTAVANIVIGLLNLGWLEWLWVAHDRLGV